jgi:hypothetical protein
MQTELRPINNKMAMSNRFDVTNASSYDGRRKRTTLPPQRAPRPRQKAGPPARLGTSHRGAHLDAVRITLVDEAERVLAHLHRRKISENGPREESPLPAAAALRPPAGSRGARANRAVRGPPHPRHEPLRGRARRPAPGPGVQQRSARSARRRGARRPSQRVNRRIPPRQGEPSRHTCCSSSGRSCTRAGRHPRRGGGRPSVKGERHAVRPLALLLANILKVMSFLDHHAARSTGRRSAMQAATHGEKEV